MKILTRMSSEGSVMAVEVESDVRLPKSEIKKTYASVSEELLILVGKADEGGGHAQSL
jgi:hypothetical protein